MSVPWLRNLWLNVALVVVVSALDGYANAHDQVWGDWLATGVFVLYATYCVQNFVRCREVHCAITAPGFLAAAVLMVLRLTGTAHYEYGLPWFVLLVSACLGFCIQWIYEARTGSVFFKR